MRNTPAALSLAILLAAACAPQTGQEGAAPDSANGSGMAASAGSVDKQAIEDSIRAMDQRWSDAAGRHDAQAFASFYADDAVLMPPNMEPAEGGDAIRNASAGLLADSSTTISFAPDQVHVADAGDIAWERGKWQAKGGDGDVLDHGKFIVVWKKTADGSWKVAADIFNSDVANEG